MALFGVNLNLALFGVLVLVFTGCNFLEVQVTTTQRAILDKGDDTEDSYTKSGDNKLVKDETSTIIKTIP